MNGTYAVILSILVLCQISAGIAGFVKDSFHFLYRIEPMLYYIYVIFYITFIDYIVCPTYGMGHLSRKPLKERRN